MTLREELGKIEGTEFRFDSDLTNYSTFRMRSKGDLAIVKSEKALSQLLQVLKRHNRQWRMIGWGANQVLDLVETDLLIQLDFPTNVETFQELRHEYDLPASVGLNILTAHAIKFSIKGWEVFTGIPASLGGAIFMNAGTALGEIGTLVTSVRVMDENGTVRNELIHPGSFSYRKNHFIKKNEIILSACLTHQGIDPQIPEKIKNYQEYRRQSQPLSTKNCGCVFKNFSKFRQAGRLIDLTGLKGLTVGALSVSRKHANFMENASSAGADDFKELTRLINQQMELHWGVKFELEVKAV